MTGFIIYNGSWQAKLQHDGVLHLHIIPQL